MGLYVGSLMPIEEVGVAAVRFRRGWLGRMIVQAKFSRAQRRLLPPGAPTEWQDAGLTDWRDADANNLNEALMIANYLGLQRSAT